MTYLWASAAVDVDWRIWQPALGDGALVFLSDTAAAHLERRERYTLHISKHYTSQHPYRVERAAQQALAAVQDLTDTLHERRPELQFTARTLAPNRKTTVLQLIPADERHPTVAPATTTPLTVQCDASWPGTQHARAGITYLGASVSIDLGQAETQGNPEAEFLALCLALLTGAADRTPLAVQGDETSAVRDARLLHEGLLPGWIYHHGNHLAQRLAIAAMTAVRMRPATIDHVPREKLPTAHLAAAHATFRPDLLHPRTWARKQGIALSWYDNERGLGKNGPNFP